MVGDASSSPTRPFDASLIVLECLLLSGLAAFKATPKTRSSVSRSSYRLDLPCLHRLRAESARAFVHWIVRQHEMTTTVTNKPIPVATRAHRHELSTLYAVRASDDVLHNPSAPGVGSPLEQADLEG
jgi:hypothetical protein